VHARAHRHKWIRNPHHVRCRVCCRVSQCVLRLYASRTMHMHAYTHTHTWPRGPHKIYRAILKSTRTQTHNRTPTHPHTHKLTRRGSCWRPHRHIAQTIMHMMGFMFQTVHHFQLHDTGPFNVRLFEQASANPYCHTERQLMMAFL